MLRDIIAKREKALPVSTIGALLKIAEENKKVVSLGPGEPDFNAPKHIIAAAKKALDKGFTHYSPPEGRRDLKEAVIRKLKRDNKIDAKPGNILVTTGSTEGILLTLMCTLDDGEGVLLPDPGFLAYKPTVEVLNGLPIPVPVLEKDNFQYSVDKMRELIIPERTKAIILNTPSNPTGTVFKKKVLEEIADFAVENKLLIISDEAYEKLVYGDARHISMGSLNGMEDYVMTLHSFSKTYAMPGFRVGYAAGPENIIRAMTKAHIFTTLCAPTLSQVAAVAALNGSQEPVRKMAREYDRRRKYIYRRVNEIEGFECVKPEGAFYLFPRFTFRMKSLGFASWLLKHAKVAVMPGTEFGKFGEGYIRFSYATRYDRIVKAMDLVERAVKRIKK
ncbi:MAG: pyridoxal phosphate-dependent aminotransferase [Candidatus Aenigmarchaeota archaeon]|nr:pyridoxal phosphate-dependent aminotransferase [Candidatus Aenigmarchaeota archaeon]